MTDTSPNIQPTPLVPDKVKEIQRQDIRDREDNHE